jgi:uncharacterized membrane protein YfcA|tara:strand:+ start:3102 stop:3842 length:741 start_codon:yes stop_codon:yes gene_type:complete
MDSIDVVLFLLLIGLGAFCQTITGFAMALIVMGGVAALDLALVSFSAAVVSIVSLVNVVAALRFSYRQVDRRLLAYLCLGLIPALIGGVVLLGYLSESSHTLLRKILGGVIIAAGLLQLMKPEPWAQRSAPLYASLAGSLGGLTGGLLSTGGAPIAFFMYRQPIAFETIRATLLSIFAVSTLGRTLVTSAAGHITADILLISSMAIPLVLLTTALARRSVPYLSDMIVRKLVLAVLIVVGSFLLVS